jgi:hypothetical protein
MKEGIPFLLLIVLTNCAYLLSEGKSIKGSLLAASPQSTTLHSTGNTSVKNSVTRTSRPQQHTWNSKPLLFPAELLLHIVYVSNILCGLRL